MGQFQDTNVKIQNSFLNIWLRLSIFFLGIICVIQIYISRYLVDFKMIEYMPNTSELFALLGLFILLFIAIHSMVLKSEKKISIYECLLYCITFILIVLFVFYDFISAWEYASLHRGH